MSRRRKPHLRCEACRMHRSLCICALLPRLVTRTRVVLVIHQLEAVKPTNTGVIAARCLANSAVVYRGRGPTQDAAPTRDEIAPEGVTSLFLFPHSDATPLESWRGRSEQIQLVVPDATWSQAARMRGRIARGLPCVSLPARGVGADRLRAAPRPGRMATLEAVAVALGILEGPAVDEALTRIYRIMTERTLWTNGRIRGEDVTGGIPAGARSHLPLG
ncbi:MAG TPA: tRNA-uridine aminocarboxypropyltransferase [Polyangia bacterium]|nr:tRNA-uridine aminocarboxypropyltransferase [Polyangia bacterium]